MSVTWNQSSLACVSSSNSKIPLDLEGPFFYSCYLKILQFVHGFAFLYIYIISNLFFIYLTKNANCIDMCVFFLNTGIFLENRSGIHCFIPLNAQLNPICHLLTLLGAHHILHVSRIRVKLCLSLKLHYEAM
jgi:hypothetical protein